MLKRLSVQALFAILALSITACPRLKGGGPSNAADAEPPSSTQVASPWASNGAEVARFPDEIPFGPDAIIARDKTPVRKSPENGDILATLAGGTDVVKLSTHASQDLVMFDDPIDSGLRLMGWVAESALEEPAPSPTPNPTPNPSPITDEDAESPPSPSPPSPSPPGGGKHHHHPHGPPRQH